ncbi:uncharacterized protein [Tenebrio molitor]|jgi:hypothetical protein|uniref:uncharacterized protein isoform X4 n=1 Tax=Tenebrio molitor TaxID=7067 RepID=UPI001C39DDA7|nr:unnamed protein product [Tenebrio molitor]
MYKMRLVRGLCDNVTVLCGLLVMIGLSGCTVGVRINRLQVPEVTQLGDPVVLDCDYTLEESLDEGLVVKWFFNETPTPIYQWIPNKKPQELGILKGRLDLEYSASTDTNSVHRALHIIQPGPDLSGDYTCFVSTFSSEDRKTKRMLVFVPEKRLELRQEHVGDGTLQVVCSAEGVFPKPNMSLHVGNSEVNSSKVAVQERAGLFDIRATAEVPSLNGPEEFSCELRIPQANYTVRKEAIYYPASGSAFQSSSTVLESVLLIFHVLFVLRKC